MLHWHHLKTIKLLEFHKKEDSSSLVYLIFSYLSQLYLTCWWVKSSLPLLTSFFFYIFWGDFFLFFPYNIQHCFICRPSDSTDAGIEPRTVATGALAVRRSNHYARSHPRMRSLLTSRTRKRTLALWSIWSFYICFSCVWSADEWSHHFLCSQAGQERGL